MAAKRKTGRPSKYTQAIADAICERLAAGVSLKAIGRMPSLPATSTIDRWRDADPAFDSRCARAIERGIDSDVDEMKEIEAKTLKGEIDPTASRAVLSSMQWRASKRFPKKYGERIQQELTGPAGSALVFRLETVGENANDKTTA